MRKQLPALTGLRFWLALWVVVYHQIPPIDRILAGIPVVQEFVHALLHTGYAAVTAFFVLSGFVLAYTYDLGATRDRFWLRRFAAARFSRIYPAYLFGLLLLIPLAIYRALWDVEIESSGALWGSFLLHMVLLQAWIPDFALTWNFPGWSLSNEAFFYALFPFLGAWLWRIRTLPALTAGLLLLWALSCAAPLIAWVNIPSAALPATTGDFPQEALGWLNFVRYNPLLRLPEFCAGILIARIHTSFPAVGERTCRWYVPGGLALLFVLAQAGRIPYPLIHNGLLLPLFGVLILSLANVGERGVPWLSSPSFLLLGQASYAMYILHAPLYAWLNIFFRHILGAPPQGWWWFFAYLLLVISAACLFWRIFEEPIHRWLRGRLSRRRVANPAGV